MRKIAVPICYRCRKKRAIAKWDRVFCSMRCAANYGLAMFEDAFERAEGAEWCPDCGEWIYYDNCPHFEAVRKRELAERFGEEGDEDENG